MAAADFNRDGNLDLAVGDGSGAGVLLGNGDGTFQPVVNWVVPGSTLTVGDFNNDGIPDIAVIGADQASESDEGAYVFLGNGDGTFQTPPVTSSVGRSLESTDLATGDFNSDGKFDLAMTGGIGVSEVAFGLGDGKGAFSNNAVASLASGYSPFGILVADLNGDGFPDLVV